MKAIAYHNYGSPDVLQCEDLEKPIPKGNEVLIKVRTASVNPLNRGELKGVPYIFRIVFGLPKPEVTHPGRPGVDVAEQTEGCAAKFRWCYIRDKSRQKAFTQPHMETQKTDLHDHRRNMFCEMEKF